jgi:hypothetical protein
MVGDWGTTNTYTRGPVLKCGVRLLLDLLNGVFHSFMRGRNKQYVNQLHIWMTGKLQLQRERNTKKL